MNIKKAIEFLEDYTKNCNGWSIELKKEDRSKFREIIDLLKCSEKYKATIIEIAKIADSEIYPYANDEERLKYILEEIEIMNKGGRRKYFPMQRDKKYEKMWNGLKKQGSKLGLFMTEVPVNLGGNLDEFMEEYEKKYFSELKGKEKE